MRGEAKILKAKSLASLRRACSIYNGSDNDGRITSFLLHLQHAFEMLLKAALVKRRVNLVGDDPAGKSVGFKRCVQLGINHLNLSEIEAGLLRAVDTMRGEEQHWWGCPREEILYVHARAAVTLYDELLRRAFGESLHRHLPHRVLPLSSLPPRDIQMLLDEEYSQIASMLRPGRRRRSEARARIRSLLALHAHFSDDEVVGKREVDDVEKHVKTGEARDQTLPLLAGLGSNIAGEGLTVRVHFTRNTSDSMPVRFVDGDDAEDAASIRDVDLQKKFHWDAAALAKKLELTTRQSLALRRYLRLDQNESCCYVFTFGKSTHHIRFSDNALTTMRDTLTTVDITEVLKWYRSQLRDNQKQTAG